MKRKKISTGIFAFLLAVLMMPASVFAGTSEPWTTGIYVEGVQVTSENCTDVLGDNTVSYDKASNTLTLDGADLELNKQTDESTGDDGILSVIQADCSLDIETKSDSSIHSDSMYFVCVSTDDYENMATLTFTGDGELTFRGGEGKNPNECTIYGNEIVNNGNLNFAEGQMSRLFYCETLENNGVINTSTPADDAFTVFEKFVQKAGEINITGALENGIRCGNYLQTGGTVNIDITIPGRDMIAGIRIDDGMMDEDSPYSFEISGGTLNINTDIDSDEISKFGILTDEAASFKATGGTININCGKGTWSYGLGLNNADYEISGGNITIKVDGAIGETSGDMDDVLFFGTMLHNENDEAFLVPEIGDNMTVTASRNLDGSAPEEYNPENVKNGYKYINMHVCTPVTDQGEAATCTKTGLTEGSHCSVCGKVLKAQEVIPVKEHTAVTDKAEAATCTKTGKTEGSHCSVCGKVLVAQKEIPVKEHTVVTDKAKAATCTKTGLTEGSHCSVCNEVLKAQQTVKAKGHKYNKGKITKAPTSAKAGVRTCKCTACGHKKTEAVAKIAKTTIKKVSPKSKSFTVTWKKSTKATGYQIMYSTSKTFKSGNVKVSISKKSTVSKKISKLKAKKTYYVKVRCYKTIDGKKYYGAWTKVKRVKTK